MIIPEIMPDELAIGYLHRLRKINGYQTEVVALKALRKALEIPCPGSVEAPKAYLLSQALHMSLEEFCRFHTMIPFIRAVSACSPEFMHGDASTMKLVRHNGMEKGLDRAFSCLDCVQEDLEYWGFAYYRRSHHLPGVMCCSKHRKALVFAGNKNVFGLPLETMLGSCSQIQHDMDPAICDTPVVGRYITIAETWLSDRKPIALNKMLDVLLVRIAEKGMRRGRRGKRAELLSDMAVEQCPAEWIKYYFPELFAKEPGEYISSMDGVLNNQVSARQTKYYVLALALLFDTAEDALNAALDPHEPISRKPTSSRRVQKEFWIGREFVQNYIDSKGNLNRIAQEIRLHPRHISEMMKSNGFPPLGRFREAELRAFRDFASGLSIFDVSEKHGVRPEAIESLARLGSIRLADAMRAFSEMGQGD